MRKSLGLTVVGFTLHFVVAAYTASQAGVNQPTPVTSTSTTKQPLFTNPKLLKLITYPFREFVGNNETIGSNPAIHLDGVSVPLTKKLSTNGYGKTTRQDIPKLDEIEQFRHVMEAAQSPVPVQKGRSQNLHERPMGEIMQAIAKQFLGAAYQADLLDQSKQETLVVTLKKFDCMLFVETVLALARGVAVQDYSYQTFVNHIQDERYQNGRMNGYCSRLHYFSQWLFDNEKRGTVKTISPELGGIPLHKTLNFMSKNRQSYPNLSNDANYKCIVEKEAKLDQVTADYIPINRIHHIYAQLQPGDIVAIATNTPGLDVTHTGLVYRYSDSHIGLIHASPTGDVKISPDLETFVGRVRKAVGIIVARPIDPRPSNGADLMQNSKLKTQNLGEQGRKFSQLPTINPTE